MDLETMENFGSQIEFFFLNLLLCIFHVKTFAKLSYSDILLCFHELLKNYIRNPTSRL